MTTAHVFIATSLDGFIARQDGSLDWLLGFSSLAEDHGYDSFIGTINGLIIGRATYQVVSGFEPWPYDRPVLVLSRTLVSSDVPTCLRGKVEIISASPEQAMQMAQGRGWHRVYIDGGATIQSFLQAGLVEDVVISRIPVLIGSGLPLFGRLASDIGLEHLETKAFPSGLVQSRYRVTSA